MTTTITIPIDADTAKVYAQARPEMQRKYQTRNPGGGDYHLSHPSAAIDAGVSSSETTDLDGDPRPSGAAPDIGADEWLWKIYLPLVMCNF